MTRGSHDALSQTEDGYMQTVYIVVIEKGAFSFASCLTTFLRLSGQKSGVTPCVTFRCLFNKS